MSPSASQSASPADRITGTLKKLFENGYGFISTGPGRQEYFVHCTELPPEAWIKGSRIEFTPPASVQKGKSPRAGAPILVALPGAALPQKAEAS